MEKLTALERNLSLENPRGFVNIGSHPSNDVVIKGSQVLPFHLMIDLRQEPYQVLPLSPESAIHVNDQVLSGFEAQAIGSDDLIQISGFSLRLHPPVAGGAPSLTVQADRTDSGVAEDGYQGQPAPEDAVAVLNSLALKPGEDLLDEYIIATLAEKTQTVNVDQIAVYTLTLTNGSPIVSTFSVQVEGVPESWVIVNPQNVNLNENGRAQVTIAITPPHRPSSTAGSHPLHFLVTSLNHPNRQSVLNGDLQINPYYDFAISDINPAFKTIPWSLTSAEVGMQVSNQGNSPANFLLTARDEEEKCRFQFMGDEGIKQAGQVEIVVPPGENRSVPVYISPAKRLLIGIHSPRYQYRVAVTQPQNNALSLFTIGSTAIRPLIGIIGILLFLIAMAGLTGYLFTPRITSFIADDNAIGEGGSTTLRWKVPIFTHSLQVTGLDDPVSGAQGNLLIYPKNTVNTYTLNATTWLWNMIGLKPVTRSFTVLQVPSEPAIKTFSVSKTDDVLQGDKEILRWSVDNSNKVQLTINGVTEVIDDKTKFNGERELDVTQDTQIYLEAFNALSSTARSIFFNATIPEINIKRFEASKATIVKGDPITINWEVTGAGMDNGGEVTISGFDGVLPNKGELTFFPTESMEFVLTVRNRTLRETRILPVGVMAEPTPPTVDFFTAAPDTLVGSGDVELAWSVSGSVDSVRINNGSTVVADKLGAQGYKTINVSTSGTYVLTATFKDKSVGANLKITVNPAMKPPDLQVVSAFPANNLQMGDTVKVTISAAQPAAGDPPPTGTVIVTDGTSSCNITLPQNSCDLVLQTSGLKTLQATFQGDDNYISAEAKYGTALSVNGLSVTPSVNLRNADQTDNSKFEFGEQLDLVFSLTGIKQTFKPNGIAHIYRYDCDDQKTNCVLSTNQPKENNHVFSASDNGSYTFAKLFTLDLFSGYTRFDVVYDGDSFYNNVTSTIWAFPDPTSKSPVSITAVQTDPTSYQYTLTVQDENAFGFYSSPKGTITLNAMLTDGTKINCTNVALTENTDKRTSSAVCTLMPTKKGTWTLSAVYTPDAAAAQLPKTASLGSFIASASVYISIASTSPELHVGVANQMLIDITDSMGAIVNQGTLELTYNGTKKICTFTGANWLCDSIRPVETLDLPIIFNFTPSANDQSTLTPQVKSYIDQVKPSTTSLGGMDAVNPAIPVPPYIPDTAYTFAVQVNNLLAGGVPPTTGTVMIKAVDPALACTDTSASPRVFNLKVDSTGLATGSVTFNSTSDSGKKLCYQFTGTPAYTASVWSEALPSIRKLTLSVSNLRVVNASIAPPPYIPGTDYTFRVTIASQETNGNLPANGTVTVKLIDPLNSCAAAAPTSDRGFSLPITDTGVAEGNIKFVADDSLKSKACYQFTGNASYSATDWAEATLDIRKTNTSVGYLEDVNSTIKPPPYLPSTTYTFRTSTSVESGNPLTSGLVNVKLIANDASCDTTASSRVFSMSIGADNYAYGNFTFQLTDDAQKICYQFAGDASHNPSAWASTSQLAVRGLTTSVSNLTGTNATVAPTPYIPGLNYSFTASVRVTETGVSVQPNVGQVNVKLISGADCASEDSTRQFTMTVGDQGAATGSYTFLDTDSGKNLCYQYGGQGIFAASNWTIIKNFSVRKLNTTVTNFGFTESGTFPPAYFSVSKPYTFSAKVTETDNKSTTFPGGSAVNVKLIASTDSCDSAGTLFSSAVTLNVSSNGDAVGSSVTFPSTLQTNKTYKLCYNFGGSNIHAATAWASTTSFSVQKRNVSVSNFAPAPTTAGYTVNKSYSFTATVTDTDSSPVVTPDGGTLVLYLVSSSVTNSSGCNTNTTMGSIPVTGGSASGSITIDPSLATGQSYKMCYRYSGDSDHGASSLILVNTAFGIKSESSFSNIPSTQNLVASGDAGASSSHLTSLTFHMSTDLTIDPSLLHLKDTTSNTEICNGASAKTTADYYCSAATVSSLNASTSEIIWNIVFKTPQSFTVAPSYDGDDKILSTTGASFAIRSRYAITWVSAGWPDSNTKLIAYYTGEPDHMTTTFNAVLRFDNFSTFPYTAAQISSILKPALSPADSLTIPDGSCTGSVSGQNATISCTGVGINVGGTKTLHIALNPTTTDDYQTSLSSADITNIKVLGNAVEQNNGPVVTISCSSNKKVLFHVTGKMVGGVPGFDNELSKFKVALGCEEDGGDHHSFRVYSFSGSDITGASYNPNDGAYSVDLEGSNAGCGIGGVDFMRMGLYYGYNTITPGYKDGIDDYYGSEDPFDLAADSESTTASNFEYFYDVSPEIFHNTDHGTNWRDCDDGDKPGIAPGVTPDFSGPPK
jgi:hypothetical protein